MGAEGEGGGGRHTATLYLPLYVASERLGLLRCVQYGAYSSLVARGQHGRLSVARLCIDARTVL